MVNSVGDTEDGGRLSCVYGGTKSTSTSIRTGVRCPAVEKLASPQQAPGSLHGEVWASPLQNQGPKIFREAEIVPGCAVTVACPSCPDHSPEPPGPGRIIRNILGWSLEEKNVMGSGVWLFRGASQGKNLFSSLDVTGDWVRKGSFRTAWAVSCDSLCTCSYSYGQGPAIGPHTGERCWPLLAGVWRAIAPLMKPWCAEGDVPTAANLNLYRGGNSCVGWHRDDEPLFGESGEAKLIVSVSLVLVAPQSSGGGVGPVRMMRDTCAVSAMVTYLSWMADVRTSFFIVRILVGNRNGSTLRSVGSNNMFPPVLCLGQEWHAVCQRVRRVHQFLLWGMYLMVFWVFLASLLCLVCLGSASFAGLSFAHKTWVTLVCLLLDTSFWRCSMGALPLEPLEGMSGSS